MECCSGRCGYSRKHKTWCDAGVMCLVWSSLGIFISPPGTLLLYTRQWIHEPYKGYRENVCVTDSKGVYHEKCRESRRVMFNREPLLPADACQPLVTYFRSSCPNSSVVTIPGNQCRDLIRYFIFHFYYILDFICSLLQKKKKKTTDNVFSFWQIFFSIYIFIFAIISYLSSCVQ